MTIIFHTTEFHKDSIAEETFENDWRPPTPCRIVGIACNYERLVDVSRLRFGPRLVFESIVEPGQRPKPVALTDATKWLQRYPIVWKPTETLTAALHVDLPLIYEKFEVTIITTSIVSNKLMNVPIAPPYEDEDPDVDGIF